MFFGPQPDEFLSCLQHAAFGVFCARIKSEGSLRSNEHEILKGPKIPPEEKPFCSRVAEEYK